MLKRLTGGGLHKSGWVVLKSNARDKYSWYWLEADSNFRGETCHNNLKPQCEKFRSVSYLIRVYVKTELIKLLTRKLHMDTTITDWRRNRTCSVLTGCRSYSDSCASSLKIWDKQTNFYCTDHIQRQTDVITYCALVLFWSVFDWCWL